MRQRSCWRLRRAPSTARGRHPAHCSFVSAPSRTQLRSASACGRPWARRVRDFRRVLARCRHGGTTPTAVRQFERTNAAPSTHQESSFEFLNCIEGDYWEHPRALMREWLDRIPSEQEYNDLHQRFDPATTSSSAARSLSSTCTRALSGPDTPSQSIPRSSAPVATPTSWQSATTSGSSSRP